MGSDSGNIPSFVQAPDVYTALRKFFQNIHDSNLFDPLPIQIVRRPLDPDEHNYYPWCHAVEVDQDALRFTIPIREKTDGFDDVREALLSCEFYGEDGRPERVMVNRTFREFFRVLIDRSPVVGEFDVETFNDVYGDFERYHKAETVPVKCWTYLFGFSMPVDEIEVDERFTIRRMNDTERGFLHDNYNDQQTGLPIQGKDFWQCWVIEYRCEAANIRTLPHEKARDQLDRLLTALRVFNPNGSIKKGSVFVKLNWDYTEEPRGLNVIRTPELRSGMGCRFNHADVDRFPAFFHTVEHLITTVSDSDFTAALNRLNESNESNDVKDRVLSCAIGFESLVLDNVRDASYSFRLQLRPSILLKNAAYESVEEVRRFFKNIYRARGEIVHGDREVQDILEDAEIEIISDDFTDRYFADQAQYFLGTIIQVYMLAFELEDMSVKELNGIIDDAAFTAELQLDLSY